MTHNIININDTYYCIISRDCLGFNYYKLIGKQSITPTVGNCMKIPDFVYFCKNFNELKLKTLTKKDNTNTKYPIGEYPDEPMSIHFVHSKENGDILKWNYRITRIPDNNDIVYFFINDFDLGNLNNKPLYEYFNEFLSIPYGHKVIFCKKDTYNNILQNKLNLDNIYDKNLVIVCSNNANELWDKFHKKSLLLEIIFTKTGTYYDLEKNEFK